MTDWQIDNLIFKPAARRAKEFQDKHEPRSGVGGRSTRLPTRDEYIEIGIKLGGTRQYWEAEYDKWAAAQVKNGSDSR